MDFGTRLQRLRKEKGWSQQELAEKAGLSKSAISMYENNQRQPDDDLLAIFSGLFDVHKGYLRGYNDLTGVGASIQDTLDEQNKSLDDFASDLGISVEDAREYLDDENREWSLNDVMRIASALDVGISKLLKWNTGLLTREQWQVVHDYDAQYLRPTRYETYPTIPVLGTIAAGEPILMSEHEIDRVPYYPNYEEGLFMLRIVGDSMAPRIQDGDLVVARYQNDVNNGEIAVVAVNGDEATCKRVYKSPDSVTLVADNPVEYPPHVYGPDDEPVTILGKVIEIRAKA